MSRRLLNKAADAFRLLSTKTCTSTSQLLSKGFATESKAASEFRETLEETRARIFGNLIGNGQRSGAKLLRKKLVGEKIASYYPEDIAKRDPFLIDTKAEA